MILLLGLLCLLRCGDDAARGDAPSAASAPARAAAADTPGVPVTIAGRRALASASSVLAGPKDRYAVRNAFDGDRATAWVEGAEGNGAGEWLRLEFEEPVEIEGFLLVPGYVRTAQTFTDNAVPRSVQLRVDGRTAGRYALPYGLAFTAASPEREGCFHTGGPADLEGVRVVLFPQPVRARTIQVEAVEVLDGARFADLAVTEWEPLVRGADARLTPAAALALLRAVRDGEELAPRTAEGASIEDLRRKYLPFDPGKPLAVHATPPEYHTLEELKSGRAPGSAFPYFPRVPREERAAGETVDARFLRYVRPSFVDAAVLLRPGAGESVLVGPRSLLHGDGEWVELYPFLALGRDGRIVRAAEVARRDGAPGCKQVVPELTSQP